MENMKAADDKPSGEQPNKENITNKRFVRALLVVAGSFFTGLGILGIFLPLLPTTPFLLLAAACYARSSEKFYHRLLNNKWFGIYIKNYREGKGIPLKVKISAISLLWLTIVLSAIFATDNLFIRIILLVIATGVTLHIAFIRNKKS
jgi:hypothetical protein